MVRKVRFVKITTQVAHKIVRTHLVSTLCKYLYLSYKAPCIYFKYKSFLSLVMHKQ